MKKSLLFFWLLVFLFSFSIPEGFAQKEKKVYTELSGKFRLDYRFYPDEALYAGQQESYWSGYFQPKFRMEWNKGKQLLQFEGFGRLDQFDVQSSHADIRELYWQILFKKWEFSVGLKKIFWGVTESNHVVDVINQADALEGFDLEQKLGQPMLHFSTSRSWGTIDLMAMPYFRTMRFPGLQGRPRPPLAIDYGSTKFQSADSVYHTDFAIRWSHSMGIFDIGLSHFYGTARPPIFQSNDGMTFFPFYELINQSSLDIQASTGPMLWKAEAAYRVSDRKTIISYVVGGEYTLYNLFRSGADLGLIAEYSYDDRGPELITALNNDLFVGMRFAANDRQSTDFLIGVITDMDNQTLRYTVSANRRFGDSWKLTLDAIGFQNVDNQEFIYLIRNDSFLRGSLQYYF